MQGPWQKDRNGGATLIKLYLKKIYTSLKKELFPSWHKAIASIFMLSIFFDFMFKGKFGYISLLRFEINNTLQDSKMEFILFSIIIFMIWKNKK